MNRLVQLQSRNNQQSRDNWACGASHRSRLTQLLTQDASPQSRLCVLGAGNCNDLNLRELGNAFGSVDLVDIDSAARTHGIEFQFPNTKAAEDLGVTALPAIDVTAIASELSTINPLDARALQSLTNQLRDCDVSGQFPHQYDTVVSCCLLSQLLFGLTSLLGHDHPQFLPLALAIRSQHIDLIVNLISRGGDGYLITDFVSSETFPDLPHVSEAALPTTILQLIRDRNFFTCLNPEVLHQQLLQQYAANNLIAEVRRSDPWLWDFGARHYAVLAFKFSRLPSTRDTAELR